MGSWNRAADWLRLDLTLSGYSGVTRTESLTAALPDIGTLVCHIILPKSIWTRQSYTADAYTAVVNIC